MGGELHVRLCVGLLGRQRFFEAGLVCETCRAGIRLQRSRSSAADDDDNVKNMLVCKLSDYRRQILLVLSLFRDPKAARLKKIIRDTESRLIIVQQMSSSLDFLFFGRPNSRQPSSSSVLYPSILGRQAGRQATAFPSKLSQPLALHSCFLLAFGLARRVPFKKAHLRSHHVRYLQSTTS